MSDQTEGTYQPDVEPGQVSQSQAGEEPSFVTRDELRALLDEQLKPVIQSLTDKQVDNRLKKWEKAMTDKGYAVDDQMRREAERRIAFSELDSIVADDKPARPVAPQIDPRVKAVQEKEAELKRQYGVEITTDDQEYWDVRFDDPDPARYLSKFERALKDKSARVGQSQPQPGNPARAPVPQGATNSDDLMAEYKKKSLTIPSGSNEMRNLRAEYRRKGLDI